MPRYDVPIMLLFFNRPQTLRAVFDWVRQVKPKQLFLVQDGPREGNPQDQENILACRRIVDEVDWDCEVFRNYSEVNLTCDHREYTGIDWCFSHVDRLMILEDDLLPALSFYEFCGELLERYKDDPRVHMITGFNRCNSYREAPYDYVFSAASAGLGWATWKRVWEQVKRTEAPLFDDDASLSYYNERMGALAPKRWKNIIRRIALAKEHDRQEGKIHSWEISLGATAMLHSSLTITPCRNLVKYNGITEDATHCYSDAMLLPRKVRKVLTQSSYELTFPLKHPPYLVRDLLFEEADRKTMSIPCKLLRKLELILNALLARRFDILFAKLKKRLKRKPKKENREP